jgi:mono/diheme cytochrome c family protein
MRFGKRPQNLLADFWMRLQVITSIVVIVIGCSRGPSREEVAGRALYQLHCSQCHDNPPRYLLTRPPKLDKIFAAQTLPSGAAATDEEVRRTIVEGLRTMPAFKGRLREDEIRDLMAFLHTLK